MQALNLKIKGLYTHPSDLSEVPEGALSVADNIVIDEESVATPRRGFDLLTGAFGTNADRANKLTVYQDTILAHYGASTLSRYSSGTSTWTDYSGTFSPPDSSTPVHFAEGNQNLYLTTSAGIKKLDVYTGTPTDAGLPKGLNMEPTLSGSSGFLATDNQVAYRGVWGIEDANENLVLGAPSQRVTIANATGGNRDVQLVVTIPAGITTSHIFQLYRSQASGGSAVEADDELQLCYEASPASGDITAGYLTITDAQDTGLLGATLYASPSQEGATAENNIPPLAKDICSYKGHMFYLNVTRRETLSVTLLARLQANDTVTVAGNVYTAKASESIADGQFQFFNTGSIAQDIADTAKSLIKIINRYAGNTTVCAYYNSGYDDTPGKLIVEARALGASAFTFTSSRTASWYPALPETSSSESYVNGLAFSKPGQSEAVPYANLFLVGSRDKTGHRALALRDAIYILKEDGVHRLLGDDAATFRLEVFDSSVRIVAPETAVVLNNQIYALTDQGVVSITDTGVNVISRPIENTILELFGASLTNVGLYSFGVGYETDRKYFLWTISSASDTYATQAFVWNTFTQTWTRWTKHAECALVSSVDDKLYIGSTTTNYLLQEKKSYGFADQVDYGFTTTVNSVSVDGLTVDIGLTDEISAGDVIYQSSTAFSIVSAVDTTAGTCAMSFVGGLTAGAATIYRAIQTEVQWVGIHAGNAGLMKHFREVSLIFRRDFVSTSTLTFTSDISWSEDEVEVAGTTMGLWGYFNWGEITWGGEVGRRPARTFVPLEKQRCSILNVSFYNAVGYSNYELCGISTIFEAQSEKMVR